MKKMILVLGITITFAGLLAGEASAQARKSDPAPKPPTTINNSKSNNFRSADPATTTAPAGSPDARATACYVRDLDGHDHLVTPCPKNHREGGPVPPVAPNNSTVNTSKSNTFRSADPAATEVKSEGKEGTLELRDAAPVSPVAPENTTVNTSKSNTFRSESPAPPVAPEKDHGLAR